MAVGLSSVTVTVVTDNTLSVVTVLVVVEKTVSRYSGFEMVRVTPLL